MLRSRKNVSLIVLLAVAVCAKKLHGQDYPLPSEDSITAIDRSWPGVSLNVLVLDKSGAPQKVDEQAFQLFEDGSVRTLRFPASVDSPVSLALLIDASGSTDKRKPEIISAIAAIIKALPADSEVMATSFTGVVFLEFPFTPAAKVDLSFMDRIPFAGPTALYDAVARTEDFFVAHAKYPRRALVVLSDGISNASSIPIGATYGLMERPGAPVVYPCLTAKANYLERERGAGLINMKALAKRGGGVAFNLDPDPAAAQIVAAIRGQYVLQFSAADAERNGKRHKIEVRLPIKDAQIHSLPAYIAPTK